MTGPEISNLMTLLTVIVRTTDDPHTKEVCGLAYGTIDLLCEEANELRAARGRLEALLSRYRDETPLGHQPHMIAHEVDSALGRQ